MEYKKNSQVEIEITDTGVSGEGIGKIDGFTLFVKDAVQGDKVLALLTKVKKNYAYARCEKGTCTFSFSHRAALSDLQAVRRLSAAGSCL